jgi:hypothetical protein
LFFGKISLQGGFRVGEWGALLVVLYLVVFGASGRRELLIGGYVTGSSSSLHWGTPDCRITVRGGIRKGQMTLSA